MKRMGLLAIAFTSLALPLSAFNSHGSNCYSIGSPFSRALALIPESQLSLSLLHPQLRVPYCSSFVSPLSATTMQMPETDTQSMDTLIDDDELDDFIPHRLPFSSSHHSPDDCPALVLNADYQPLSYLPLSLWCWQDAIKAVFTDKAVVLACYDVEVRSPSIAVKLPSVIALKEYIKRPMGAHVAVLSRRNVYIRDEFRCQYCGNSFTPRQLSLDHLIPRCKGGRLTWQNVVSACHHCNGKKGHLMPENIGKVGLKLKRKPYVPTQLELHHKAKRFRPTHLHPDWTEYL